MKDQFKKRGRAALRQEITCKLGLVICIIDRARSEAITDGKGYIVLPSFVYETS